MVRASERNPYTYSLFQFHHLLVTIPIVTVQRLTSGRALLTAAFLVGIYLAVKKNEWAR